MSARLTLIKNPFIPEKNRITGYYPYKTIGEARAWLDGQEVNITVDGWAVTDSYEPKTGEMVVITPVVAGGGGGKSILGVVAMIAVSVVSMGVGSFVAGNGFWTMSLAGAKFGAFAAAAATLFIGGTLVSRIMTSATTVDYGDYESSATYSWGDPTTMEGQNNPIAITYGKVQSAGQTIGKFVSLDDDGNEVLNWLVACGEGELEISDIKLNDNAISYYTSVTAETRSGTNNQEIISNFNDTYFTLSIASILSGITAVTRTAQGTATEGLIYKFGCESGLYYGNDDGSLGNAWVKIKMEYKLTSASTWTEWKTVTITGNQNSALRKEYRLDNLPAGEYDVRATCIERSHSETSSRACVKVYFTSITSIVYDDFCYPGIALIGIKGLATDQLSGTPTLKFIKERKYIWTYNPTTGAYEQQLANNPAWAAYDMLAQIQKVRNINTGLDEYITRGVDKDRILYDQFAEWATWCAGKELYVNLEVVETGELLNIINNNIACIGRGLVIRFGTRYGCKWSHVQDPVQMFGMGNIIKDSFEENFLSLEDRANAVEVTFTDADRDFERRTITIFGDTYNTDAVAKSAQVAYNGITSYTQAFREGKYQLACNKYLLRTVAFNASVDSIACTVGDVIIVAHDIIKAAYSGRISAVSGTAVTLPTVDTVDTTLSYKLMFRSSQYDTLEDVTCTLAYNSSGELVATMTETLDHAPVAGDIYDLALVSTGRRMYTVQSITRTSDFERHIEALEYNANIYDENYTIPEISYTRDGGTAKNVTGLSAAQVAYVKKDGTHASQLNISWNAAVDGGHYSVYISTNGVEWTLIKSNTSQLQLKTEVQPWTTYYVKVITVLGVTQSTGTVLYPVPPGSDVLPPSVTELNAEVLSDGTRRYYWTFNYPDPDDIAGFRMKYYQGTGGNWNTAVDVQEGLITAQPYEATTIRQGAHTVMIKAVDNAGQESPTAASCVINCGEPLVDNVVDTKDFSENNWACLNFGYFWNDDDTQEFWQTDDTQDFWRHHAHGGTARGVYVGEDGKLHTDAASAYWKTPGSSQWPSATGSAWTSSLADVYVEFTHTVVASGYWWLQYNITGAFTIYYWLNSDGVKKQYNTRIKVSAGDVIHISLEASNSNITVSSLTSIVDVPDRVEHFSNLAISASGTTLAIKTPNYKTVAVHIDSIPLDGTTPLYPQIVTREPCVIKLVAADGTAHNATAMGITWQGYEKEV